jgi:hypothetical protein
VNFRWPFTFFVEKSYGNLPSHLARLWIGAACSNTSTSIKSSSTTVKLALLVGKGSGSTAVLL